jgi:hypothetical protein
MHSRQTRHILDGLRFRAICIVAHTEGLTAWPGRCDLLLLPILRAAPQPNFANSRISQISTFTMGYEDSVYLAKLAEQAERYEGKHSAEEAASMHADPQMQRWSRT